jgi:hypothetical protein
MIRNGRQVAAPTVYRIGGVVGAAICRPLSLVLGTFGAPFLPFTIALSKSLHKKQTALQQCRLSQKK